MINLQSWYEESGSYERGRLVQITLSGTQLQQSTYMFEPCPNICKLQASHKGRCTCARIQQLVFRKNDSNITMLQDMADSAAIIIGQVSRSWKDWFRSPNPNSSHAKSARTQASILPPENATPKSTSMSQIMTVQRDTFELKSSIDSEGLTFSLPPTQALSSSKSGFRPRSSSGATESSIELLNGKQPLKASFPSRQCTVGTIIES
ncbi:hypothetical protein EJ04DRAFT_160518 [Polyplosphaeria fusca]|uniref:Uncharacterized protein n=1 Tax=Polyplosphaeria fusca TaxID=682080 RepID=A0A9P4QGD7_9PLEO|nr:hypothetical protein EJ04DRAFT_160518 [Polyplosphaeria fusca]